MLTTSNKQFRDISLIHLHCCLSSAVYFVNYSQAERVSMDYLRALCSAVFFLSLLVLVLCALCVHRWCVCGTSPDRARVHGPCQV